MGQSHIDAFCNGSSLAHAVQGLFRERPIYARGVRSGAKVLLAFFVLGLLFAALVSVGIVLSEETGIGTLAQHATGWWAAMCFLALLSVIVIQFSMMGAIGAFDLSSSSVSAPIRYAVLSPVLPRPPTVL